MRAFFGLAATEMRRELLDLARHFGQANRAGAAPGRERPENGSVPPEPAAPAEEPEELERWCRFHEEVERLSLEEREVVGLIFYHGWEQAEVAEALGITVRTVQRRWQAAMVKLHALLHGA
jgi:RNA polymerase sigma-70 factor (ECF subfamily)